MAAAFLASPVVRALPASPVALDALVCPAHLDSPVAHRPSARSPPSPHAESAHLAHPETLELPESLETPAHLDSPAVPETMDLPAHLDPRDLPEMLDSLVAMELVESPADPPSQPLLCLETPDSPETRDLPAFPESLDSLVATDSPDLPDPRAHPDLLAHLDNPAVPEMLDPRAHPDSRESVVSAPNTAQPMVAFSSRMEPGNKRWPRSSPFQLSPVRSRHFATTIIFPFNNSIRSPIKHNNNNDNAANYVNIVTSRFCKDVFCIDLDSCRVVLMLFLLVHGYHSVM